MGRLGRGPFLWRAGWGRERRRADVKRDTWDKAPEVGGEGVDTGWRTSKVEEGFGQAKKATDLKGALCAHLEEGLRKF